MKPHLILIHSFPTNSKLLAGLIEYLEDFFIVHFIDLPGFVKSENALDHITIESYSSYVQSKVDALNLGEYYIGGISFGFITILHLHLDNRCKGILAIEPFLGTPSLRVKNSWRFVYTPIISLLNRYKLGGKIWSSRVFRFAFEKYFLNDRPVSVSNCILNEIDGNAFFQTFQLILSTPLQEKLHSQIPHVLLVNREDQTIRSEYITSIFRQKIPKLLVVENTMPHFPDDLSKTFFEREIQPDLIMQTIDFLSS